MRLKRYLDEGKEMGMGAWKMPDGKVYSASKKKRDKDGMPTQLSWAGKVFPVKNGKVKLPTGTFNISEGQVDYKKAAKELHDLSVERYKKDKNEGNFHYRAYLRAVMQGQPADHLIKKFSGAKKARQDLIDRAGGKRLKEFNEAAVVRSLMSHMPQDFMSSKKLPANLRKRANTDINTLLKPTYFDSIPLKDIFKILEKHGIVPLQEDATYWSGILTGGVKKTEMVYFNLGWKEYPGKLEKTVSAKYPNRHGQYLIIPNAVLSLSYYKMPKSGRYEVIAYVS